MSEALRGLPPEAPTFRRRLLGWYRRHRRTLPWRGVRDPYAVLVSEIMLQQTQVVRVTMFYSQFLARYPTVEDLAAAPTDAVRESWNGLGYYARAHNLQAAARRVVEDHGGMVPSELDLLRRLPGVGRYTAGAVASLAFGRDVPAVDTNVARVLARVLGVRGKSKSARREHRLWDLAARLVPRGRAADWNQALMDLGATVCTARAPRCPSCPVRLTCRAWSERRGRRLRRARSGRDTRRRARRPPPRPCACCAIRRRT
jgi:A/G-specific adenine glycosylase